MPGPPWRVVSIIDGPFVDGFDCDIAVLNDYLKRYAGQNHRKGFGRTYVLIPSSGPPVAIGYHTLCMAHLEFEYLSPALRRRLPRYPVPAVRLARLAVDRRWQARKLGELLLVDAIRRSVHAAGLVAAKFMVVDAIDAKAAAFYERYGFKPIEGRSRALVASLDSLRQIDRD